MGKIRLGVLGATRGIDFALVAKKHGLQAELTAVCDTFQPLLDKIQRELPEHGLDPECYTDFYEMLEKADIDAVVIANNANNHAPYAIAALNAGKHVLSEVLPVQTPAQAVALVEAVEKSGKVYYYAENYCYFSGNLEAELLYREGTIGEIIYAECDFVNDLAARWHLLTRGRRNHWRNFIPSTFYCTHSTSPLFFALQAHPVRVSGFEVPSQEFLRSHGARCGTAATEMMLLANGVPIKSTHGNLRRPWETRLRLVGTKGCLESTNSRVTLWLENNEEEARNPFKGEELPIRTIEGLSPEIRKDEVAMPLAIFLGVIRKDPVLSKLNIDVYQALDMALPGVMAYRSIMQGNIPVEIPDFRDTAIREKYRHDNMCTDPEVASGEELLPSHSMGEIIIEDSVYEKEAEKAMESFRNKFKLGYI